MFQRADRVLDEPALRRAHPGPGPHIQRVLEWNYPFQFRTPTLVSGQRKLLHNCFAITSLNPLFDLHILTGWRWCRVRMRWCWAESVLDFFLCATIPPNIQPSTLHPQPPPPHCDIQHLGNQGGCRATRGVARLPLMAPLPSQEGTT